MLYLDTSALVKLVVLENESDALQEYLTARKQRLVTSRVGEIELRRAGSRGGAEATRIDALLLTVSLIELDANVAEAAVRVDPALRALDAIHLGSAVLVGAEELVCYDQRLAAAAGRAGLPAIAPA